MYVLTVIDRHKFGNILLWGVNALLHVDVSEGQCRILEWRRRVHRTDRSARIAICCGVDKLSYCSPFV
jgi:hypothetical protein